MPEQTSNVPAPIGIALVICDNVYEASDGKRALVGLFSRIVTHKFPATHAKLCAFVSITDVHRFTSCKLDIVNIETDHVVASAEGPMPSDGGPTIVWDLVFELRDLVFPEPGQYDVRFFGNDQCLVQRPFEVLQIQERGSES